MRERPEVQRSNLQQVPYFQELAHSRPPGYPGGRAARSPGIPGDENAGPAQRCGSRHRHSKRLLIGPGALASTNRIWFRWDLASREVRGTGCEPQLFFNAAGVPGPRASTSRVPGSLASRYTGILGLVTRSARNLGLPPDSEGLATSPKSPSRPQKAGSHSRVPGSTASRVPGSMGSREVSGIVPAGYLCARKGIARALRAVLDFK